MNKIICILLLTISVSAFAQNKMVIKKTPQKLDTVSVTGDILKISLTGDGEPAKEVTLPSGGSGSDGITQVASVTALRATSGTTTKDVYLKSYWSGLGYGGGRFTWHSTDVTGRGDDGGISFAASGGGYWVRTEPEFRATYFGLVDTSDLAAISKTHNTWEVENFIKHLPDGGKMVFDPGFTFKHYGSFNFNDSNLKRVNIEGYGSTLLRGAQIQDSIKSNSTTWVRVAHPERWDIFMYVSAYDGTDRMTSNAKITRIGGDTLFVAIGSGDYATGDLFTQSFQMSFIKENCTLRGLTFDGNLDENMLYNYWGSSGELYVSSPNAFVNRITVRNSPGEAILLFESNCIVDGFNIQNCNGNGIHTGSNDNYQILNGVIKNVNNLIRRDGITTLGHEGGAIAHSVDVHGGMVSNIQIDSAYVAIADINGSDDSLNHYDRIDARNCNKAVEFNQGFSQGTASYLRVTNSRFFNCGSFEIKANPTGPTDSSEYVRDVILDNVQLFNTYLDMNARSYNVTMNNIYIQDTGNVTYHVELAKHLKVNGLVKIGGGKIYFSECNRSVIENFEIRETNSTNSAIDFTWAENAIIRNGAIYQTSAASGFVGIYGGVGNEISDVFIDLAGSPTYGIFANASSTQVATTVKNCTVLTPLGVPSIRCYGGSSGGLFINNKVNNDISNVASNDDYGTVNVTDDDVTWGNTTTLKILGKIRDSAGNLGATGQALVSDGSGFSTWQSVGSGDITAVNVTGYLTGGGTSGDVTIGIDTTGTVGVATKYDLTTIASGGITSLNGLTAATQTFATGTSGTDFNINSTTATHTFNFPNASGSNRGLLTSTDWTTFNNKWTPSGAIGYVPFFSSTTALTNQHDFITYNSGSAFKLGLGFTSGGNSQLENYLTSTAASGLVIQDGTLPGLGLSTSTSNRWALMLNTSGELSFNRNTGGSWASPYITIGSAGTLKVTDLAGSGTRMAVVSADGTFSTQSIPSGAVSSVTGTNNIVASPTTGAVIITDNQTSQAQLYNVGAQNYSTSSTTPVKVEGSTAIVGGSGIAASTSNENISITPSGTYRITYTINAMATATGGNTNSPIHSTQIYINGSPGANNGFCREISGSGQWVTLSRNEITLLPANAVIDLRYNHGATGSFDVSIGQAYINVQRIQ